MRSTFMGLEAAKRGMFTQQGAIYVTGHNIANVNTPGYSRQRVNFVQTEPYPAPGMNRPQIPGQMGTGVEAGSIQRVREKYVDVQYRGESNKLGYWDQRAQSLSKLEDILNEQKDTGLNATMAKFWQSLQDLSVHPENEGARAVVLQRGLAVAETFHYYSNSISGVKEDLRNEISVSVKDINSLLDQINNLNNQIGELEPHGYLPNDLYDERDRLVDDLSKYMNIKVEQVSSGPTAPKIADGKYSIYLVDGNGNKLDDPKLIDAEAEAGQQVNHIGIEGGFSSDDSDIIDMPAAGSDNVPGLTIGGESIEFYSGDSVTFSQGKLRGLIESFGYEADGETKGIYPEMLDKFDKLAYTFGTIFNEIHAKGYNLNGENSDKQFFGGLDDLENGYKGAAALITRNINDTSEIQASTTQTGAAGDGKNAINLSNIQNVILSDDEIKLVGFGAPDNPETISISGLDLPIKEGTLNTYRQGVIGRLGVDSQQASNMSKNSGVLLLGVDKNRQSISSVSLDEEMTDLIKFQHAYNASARNITVVDEMLDKIINSMGVVGR